MSEGKRVVRQYPVEFKVDAVIPATQGTGLLEEKGYTVSEAANSLGIPQANLTNWRTTGTSFGRRHFLRSPRRSRAAGTQASPTDR